MELKEYLKIIRKNNKIFFLIIILVVAGSLSYFYFQPYYYKASLMLNVTRLGIQETSDYRYDDYYRLQADERFIQTISQWLKNPKVVEDIYSSSGINVEKVALNKLSKAFLAEKKSSQILSISFSASNQELAKKISDQIIRIVSQKTEELNREQQEENWFKIISEEPLIRKNEPNLKIISLASFLAGIFLAFWIVMIKHYFE